jgi:enolase-phosphatase E1
VSPVVIDGVRWVVVDIEGTLTPTDEVLVVLYDYARPRLAPWIDEHGADPTVARAVHEVRLLGDLAPDAGTAEVVAVLQGWMDEDRKATPLKTLQGQIWARGYAAGELTTRFFPDAVPVLRAWRADGLSLAVFSSGSVAAQLAAFSRSTDGDITDLFSHHFDTVNAGPKREAASYRAMTAVLAAGPDEVQPGEIVFCSDVPGELDGAVAAGWRAVGVARPGEPYERADFGDHPVVADLGELVLERAPVAG